MLHNPKKYKLEPLCFDGRRTTIWFEKTMERERFEITLRRMSQSVARNGQDRERPVEFTFAGFNAYEEAMDRTQDLMNVLGLARVEDSGEKGRSRKPLVILVPLPHASANEPKAA